MMRVGLVFLVTLFVCFANAQDFEKAIEGSWTISNPYSKTTAALEPKFIIDLTLNVSDSYYGDKVCSVQHHQDLPCVWRIKNNDRVVVTIFKVDRNRALTLLFRPLKLDFNNLQSGGMAYLKTMKRAFEAEQL